MTILKDLLLPMPGEQFDGRIVIASIWIRDDEQPPLALLMLLNSMPPYYTVAEITFVDDAWTITSSDDHPNINPATACYADNGGDY